MRGDLEQSLSRQENISEHELIHIVGEVCTGKTTIAN